MQHAQQVVQIATILLSLAFHAPVGGALKVFYPTPMTHLGPGF
jgi:hypothetical protein